IKNLGDAQSIAGKVVAEARKPVHVDGRVLRVGASVGVAADASPEQGGGKALIARADEMLYRAKRSGRDRYQMHLVKA
ncbi:MAG TPA: diguanylate cyclase, partial [Steroidobacteraceae bacterium]|nr:diguanylate cyclase [Steroidobacteraceae bacterium]